MDNVRVALKQMDYLINNIQFHSVNEQLNDNSNLDDFDDGFLENTLSKKDDQLKHNKFENIKTWDDLDLSLRETIDSLSFRTDEVKSSRSSSVFENGLLFNSNNNGYRTIYENKNGKFNKKNNQSNDTLNSEGFLTIRRNHSLLERDNDTTTLSNSSNETQKKRFDNLISISNILTKTSSLSQQISRYRSNWSDFTMVNTPNKPLHSVPLRLWYQPDLTRDEANVFLENLEDGRFIVRKSRTYNNGYGLAVKYKDEDESNSDNTSTNFVRHYLIETVDKGVRLKSLDGEPIFTSLYALVFQHSIDKLCLPTKLLMPTTDEINNYKNTNISKPNYQSTPKNITINLLLVDSYAYNFNSCVINQLNSAISSMFEGYEKGEMTEISSKKQLVSLAITNAEMFIIHLSKNVELFKFPITNLVKMDFSTKNKTLLALSFTTKKEISKNGMNEGISSLQSIDSLNKFQNILFQVFLLDLNHNSDVSIEKLSMTLNNILKNNHHIISSLND